MYRVQPPDGEPEGSFVPLERLRRSGPLRLDRQALLAASGHLEDFAARLTDRERQALVALLRVDTPESALAALGAESPEEVFEPGEIPVVNGLSAIPVPETAGRSTLVMVMKATRRCNLRCTYCHSWAEGPNQVMPLEVLARATHGALTAPGARVVEFVWHGGETTLLPLSFYRKALWLQQRFRRPGQKVSNALQTNGTNLSPEWLGFCRRYGISLGISLDGPPEVHDRRRVDSAGRPTSERVRKALAEVQENGLEHGVLMVVDEDVAAFGAERLLHYLLEIGVEQVGLLNVIPENTAPGSGIAGSYLPWQRFVGFLRDLFRAWWPAYVERISFREISDLLGKVRGEKARTCVFNGNCMGGFLTVEPMGEISACDKYIRAEGYQFGNILEASLADLLAAPALAKARARTEAGIDLARSCPWFAVCAGGCPHDRYLRGERGVPHDESCCGLASLLEDMKEALDRLPPTV